MPPRRPQTSVSGWLLRACSAGFRIRRPEPTGTALKNLTLAALAIPGLAGSEMASAEPDDLVSLGYGHYHQSQWQLYDGARTGYQPLQVDTLEGQALLNLNDRWTFGVNYVQDTWSGATPVASAPNALGGNNKTVSGASPLIKGNGSMAYSRDLTPYRLDAATANYVRDPRLVQTIASASPETRNQGDFRLGYSWDDVALNVNGGTSQERDYSSAFGGFNGLFDFNQKRTTLNVGTTYNNSGVFALINPMLSPYLDTTYYQSKGQIARVPTTAGTNNYVTGNRQDWSSHLSLSQVVNAGLVVESGVGFIRSTGYLANPYKAVDMVFVDWKSPIETDQAGVPALYQSQTQGVLEKRPEIRNQGVWNLKLVQYIEPFDASFHAGYTLFHDDWGITASTFDMDWVQPLPEGWTVTPRFRYYAQSEADFYQPYFLVPHAMPTTRNGQLNLGAVPFQNYSSDYRLSAYGALSGGITVSKRLGKALGFEAGFEYYTHGGDLIPGNSGQGSWANFDFYQYNVAVKVDPSVVSMESLFDEADPHSHAHHAPDSHMQDHLGMEAPAGVMFSHMLNHAGDSMIGVRYQYQNQSGHMMQGTRKVSDLQVVNQGCPGSECLFAPNSMSMNMYMVDLMYAPTDWMTLMLMPQFMTNEMHLRGLDGAPAPSVENGHAAHGANPNHSSGGVGDVDMAALVELYETPGHKIHATVGFTAPTGSIRQSISGNSEYQHYMMQLGSGTWNFWPSITYNGFDDKLFWGGQLSAIAVLEGTNDAGYRNGDLFQSTAWAGYQLAEWLNGTLRGVYTYQDRIHGAYNSNFNPGGPMDYPQNYGGQFFDVGFGLNTTVHQGAFQGNHFGVEWVQPAYSDYNGTQLSRAGSLWANWSLTF